MQEERKKLCTRCHKWLSYDSFWTDNKKSDGLFYCCKDCGNKLRKEKYSPSKNRAYRLRYEYNITLTQYDRILANQGGVCAICGESKNANNQYGSTPLVIDHDHKTGDVRALLCSTCNQALGLMYEDPKRIRALLRYAEWCQTREPDIKIIQPTLLDLAG